MLPRLFSKGAINRGIKVLINITRTLSFHPVDLSDKEYNTFRLVPPTMAKCAYYWIFAFLDKN